MSDDFLSQSAVGWYAELARGMKGQILPTMVFVTLSCMPTVAQQNVANNPLTDIPMIQGQNYLQTGINGDPGGLATFPYQRWTLPWEVSGWKQLMRVSMEAGTTVWGKNGAGGIGDLTIYNVPIFAFDNVKMGVGPLLVVPTANSSVLDERKWQMGGEGVVSAVYNWGLLGALVSYQQAVNSSTRSMTFQPFLFYNLSEGLYLRSTGISKFFPGSGAAVLPVGLGIGRVMRLDHGTLLNMYIEPQYSVVRTGAGQPRFQLFIGFNLQFPPDRLP